MSGFSLADEDDSKKEVAVAETSGDKIAPKAPTEAVSVYDPKKATGTSGK